jgi:hypothetical protein
MPINQIKSNHLTHWAKVFRDRWQSEFKIIHHIIPDPSAFKEALKGLFLILSK